MSQEGQSEQRNCLSPIIWHQNLLRWTILRHAASEISLLWAKHDDCTFIVSAHRRLRQEGCKFKAFLAFMERSNPAGSCQEIGLSAFLTCTRPWAWSLAPPKQNKECQSTAAEPRPAQLPGLQGDAKQRKGTGQTKLKININTGGNA